MKKITIEEAKEGDVLAREVLHSTGSLILAAGSRLSTSVIARLRKMSVRELTIDQVDDSMNAAGQAQRLAAIEARFRNAGTDSYLNEMKKIVIDHANTP